MFSLISVSALCQSSVLSSGIWYKFSVTEDGVYKISYALLQKAGINPAQIDPKNVRIFTGQVGMLPQANSVNRIKDLAEVAITVVGEEDGKFNSSDYVLFYANGPDAHSYDTKSSFFSYQSNLYSTKNFYFLTISSSPGRRISSGSVSSGNFPLITQFDDFAYYENDKYNLLHSGRQWFGEQFDQTLQLTVQADIPGIVPSSNIKLTSHVMAHSITDCSFSVSYNNAAVITQKIAAVPNTTFDIKGRVAIDTISLDETSVSASSKTAQLIKYQFNKGGPGISVGYLDYLLLGVKRKLALYGSQTFFISSESLANPFSAFQINAVSSTGLVWDVTDPVKAKSQITQLNNDAFTFSTRSDSLKRFVVFDPAKISSPSFESKVNNQNLHGITSADVLIISHPTLVNEAVRLGAHRQSHDQLAVVSVTTDAVYNEYSGGKPDPTALRDFIRDVYKKSNGALKYVLLFGRGSYDYKDRVLSNTNLVPTYESFASLDPLATYSSDDYYGFLEDTEGSWGEDPPVNYSMDVGVGRIPAKDAADAQAIVDKLIDYDTNPNRFGPWRKNFLFVADDGDTNLHESQSDQLANSIEQNHSEFDAKKLFLDEYKQITKPIGQFSPDATKALDLAIRQGKVVINYTGHGSERVWAQEQLLTPDLVTGLKNAPKYPLFVTATCEFGRNDDPFIISSAELLLLQKKGGAIGLVTTARPVYSTSNFQLNQAFYEAVFTKSDGQFRRLGDIMRDTKNKSVSGDSNRNFSLLGDPSMKLAFANDQVVATEIKTTTGSDTLKALSSVSIKGQIQNAGNPVSNFNGTVYVTLFDKIQNLKTLGDSNETVNPTAPPYNFSERSNKLFRGSASVLQGKFQVDFDMPRNLVSGFSNGKLSFYAFQDDATEASGYANNFRIGGLESTTTTDTTPPEIRLYLSDSTFTNGGTVGPNTQLFARLSDASGVNVASIDSQNSIVATLDDKWSYVLNDFYTSDKNDAQQGTVIYPLDTLKKGTHTLALAASDTYGNRSSAVIDFVVTDGSGIAMSDFFNSPNPFYAFTETSFYFTHTRAGEDLDATLIIYDFTGKPLNHVQYSITASGYTVDLGKWNNMTEDGIKIGAGIYVARLFVRSLADGSQCDRTLKLIILN